uniref:Uncharacterized protein n=1 Tax=Geospiza parvula TaxID=87175 RepID=A0A8U8AWT7_GEOPR
KYFGLISVTEIEKGLSKISRLVPFYGVISDLTDRIAKERSCGSSKISNLIPRIVGGSNTEEGEWPWQVSLHFVGAAYCGASVISKEWLVSAAHCFQGSKLADPRAWRAHLGMQMQGRAKFVAAVPRIVVHEYYNSRNYDYDIALLQLSTPWPDTMAHLIQPICLPPSSHKARSGDKCWITGWGQKQEAGSAVLQKAEIEIIDQTLCHSTYGIITARMFCAGLSSGKRDGCKVSTSANSAKNFSGLSFSTFTTEIIIRPIFMMEIWNLQDVLTFTDLHKNE